MPAVNMLFLQPTAQIAISERAKRFETSLRPFWLVEVPRTHHVRINQNLEVLLPGTLLKDKFMNGGLLTKRRSFQYI